MRKPTVLALLVLACVTLAWVHVSAQASGQGVPASLGLAAADTQTFADVPPSHPYYAEIEWLYQNGYTAGCAVDPLRYCPDVAMNRAESAVFVERGIHAASYDPPVPTEQIFADLPLDSWAAKWVNGLWEDRYTSGCGTSPLIYCPWQGHTRAEGCVFYLRMLNGATYQPPQPTLQTFGDVPLDAWYAKWVEAAYEAALIPACQTSDHMRFCPGDPLSRGLAAYMMVRAKSWPGPTPTAAPPTFTPAPPTSTPTAIEPSPTPTCSEGGPCVPERIFYVSPTGSDSNPGTESNPWRTIQHAANTLVAGEGVYVRAGTYRERVVPRNSGIDSSHYITYAAFPGERVTLDGTGVAVPSWEGLFYLTGRDYIRIVGLQIAHSSAAGFYVEGSGYIRLENNSTYDTGSSGIGVWSSHDIMVDGNDIALSCSGGAQEALSIVGTTTFEVKNNRVHNDNVAGYPKEGIDIKKGSREGLIYRNQVYQLQSSGIYVDAQAVLTGNIQVFQNVIYRASGGISLASETGGLLDNVSVYNNIAYNNKWYGIWLTGCCGTGIHPIQNVQIVNNTFYNNGGLGIGLYDNPDMRNIMIRNNISSQNPLNQIVVSGVPTGTFTIDHNLVYGNTSRDDEFDGTDVVAGDPQFVDPSGGDFHVLPGSPAIDGGTSLNAPPVDFDGHTRPQGAGFDIGAFEYAPQ